MSTRAASPASERTRLLEAAPDPIPPQTLDRLYDDSENAAAGDAAITKLRGSVITISLLVLVFLQAINFSLLTTTQSAIAGDLDAYAEASWFTSSYLIAMSSVAPLAGRLSQIFSPRNCIFAASILFAAGAMVTSRADGLAIFLLGRVVTGLGAAGVMTLCIILIIQLSSERKRGTFFGLINAAITMGVSLGAILGGALLEPVGWRALFWMQAPLSIAAGSSVLWSIPRAFSQPVNTTEKRTLWQKLARIDYLGAVLLTSCLVLVLTGLSAPKILWLPVGLSAVVLILFVFNESHLAKDPVIPVTLFKSRSLLFACLAQLTAMMSRWIILFYTPVYAIAVRGWSPASAGSILVSTNAGFALGGVAVGVFHINKGGSFYTSALVCFAVFPITLVILSKFATEDSSIFTIIAALAANGFVAGSFMNYTLVHILHLTSPEHHPVVTSIIGTFRGFSGSFASAIGAGIFVRILKHALETGFRGAGLEGKGDLIRRLLGQPALVRSLEGLEKEIARQAYDDAIRGLFLAGVVTSLLTILLQAGTGWKSPADVKKNGAEDDSDGSQ